MNACLPGRCRRSRYWLELRIAELPEQKRILVGHQRSVLGTCGPDAAVAAIVVDAEKHRLTARSSALEARRHLSHLPRTHPRIVDPGGQEHGRKRRFIFRAVIGADRQQVVEVFFVLQGAKFGDILPGR